MRPVTPLCYRYRSLLLMWIMPVILELASKAHDASDTVGYRATAITVIPTRKVCMSAHYAVV